MIPFSKGHGLGNDYLVIDDADLPFPLSPPAIALLCDRNLGIGSDGILLRVSSARAAFGLRIFNPDGSEAEKSGNGLRIFAKYLWDQRRTTADLFTVDTPGGIVECRCHVADGHMQRVTVEMGGATFQASAIPMLGPKGDAVAVPLAIDGEPDLSVTAVSVGNPHCVVFVDRLDQAECRRLGPQIENHPAFPNRINVQFAHARSAHEIAILIWERGAGYTLASGSSSCAAAAAAVRTGRCTPGPITVHMSGGELTVDVRPDFQLRLEGPVASVYTGALTDEFIDDLRRAGP